MNKQQPFAYSIKPKNQRVSRVVTNPLTNSFNSVDAIVDNINISANLPPFNFLHVEVENYPFDQSINEQLLQVSYPDIPSFLPSSEDISFFKMIGDGMVSSTRDSTEADFQEECCIPYQDYIINQSILSEEEKQICELKLTRFEYEKKQSTSFIQDSVEEDNLLDACSDINPSTPNTDRKYINDFVTSHFHDLLTPMKLSFPPTQSITPIPTESIQPTYSATSPEDSNEYDIVTSSYINVLSSIIQDNESLFDKPVPATQFPSKSNMKNINSSSVNQMFNFYNKAKDVDKTSNRLPYKLDLMQNDPTVTLPHRRRASSSSSSISTFSMTSRSSSISADISQIQGELYSVLTNVSRLDDGVNRVNEIKNHGMEITESQKNNRQLRDDITTEVSPSIWKSVYNIFDEEKKQVEDTYDRMISMRMSYCPVSPPASLEEVQVNDNEIQSVKSTFLHDQSGMYPYLMSSEMSVASSQPDQAPSPQPDQALSSQPDQSPSSQPDQSPPSQPDQSPPSPPPSQSSQPPSSQPPLSPPLSPTLPSRQPPSIKPPLSIKSPRSPPSTIPTIKPPPAVSPFSRSSRIPSEPLIIEQPRLREGARITSKNDPPTPVLAIPLIDSLQQHKGRISQSRSSLQPPSTVHPSIQIPSSRDIPNRDTLTRDTPNRDIPNRDIPNRDTLDSSLPVQSTPSQGSETSTKPTIVIPLPKRRLIPRKQELIPSIKPTIPKRSIIMTNRSIHPNSSLDEIDRPVDPTLSHKPSEAESVNSNGGISTSLHGSLLSASATLSRSRRSMMLTKEDLIPETISSEVIKKVQPESSQSDTMRVSLMVNDMDEQIEQEENDSDLDREVGAVRNQHEMTTEEILAGAFTEDMLNVLDSEIIL